MLSRFIWSIRFILGYVLLKFGTGIIFLADALIGEDPDNNTPVT